MNGDADDDAESDIVSSDDDVHTVSQRQHSPMMQ